MNVFFDTEFTGLVPGTQLISIGMVTESPITKRIERLYAEFTDYDINKCDDWIKANVINHTIAKDYKATLAINSSSLVDSDRLGPIDKEVVARMKERLPKNTRYLLGDSEHIAFYLKDWLSLISGEHRIQLISDVSHYDMYLLCNLFGGAFSLPENVNPVCYDICQDIWAFLEDDYTTLADRMHHSFDISREEIINSVNLFDSDKPNGYKHNSLYDAEVIKYIYKSYIGE